MLTKYKFPMQIYLIFEHLEPIVYTSHNLTPNHYVIFVPTNHLYNITAVLKNEVFFSFNYLSEMSAIDTLKYSNFIPTLNFTFLKNRIILFYIFYTYCIKLRLTLFASTSNVNTTIQSLEMHYKNAN